MDLDAAWFGLVWRDVDVEVDCGMWDCVVGAPGGILERKFGMAATHEAGEQATVALAGVAPE